MSTKEYPIVDNAESFEAALARVREAQKIFATYTQEQVDKIFLAAATAANQMRIPLAKMAVEETGMGVAEDKVIKNHFASEYIYNAYRNVKTCGVLEEDKAYGIKKIAEPIGVIAAVIPTTNPTSTAIFKTLVCLKTRNGIIISPHPRAKKSTIEAAKVVLEAAVKAGAPEAGLIFLHSSSQTHLCRKLTASSQQAAPAWLRLLIHQVSLHSVLAPVTHLLSLMKQLTFYSQLTQLSTQRHLITV